MAFLDKILASSIQFVPKSMMRPLSTRYIAGESRDDALQRGQDLRNKSYSTTFDLLGEAVTNQSEIDGAANEYLELIDTLVKHDFTVNVSLKPTQMGLNLSQDHCFRTVDEIIKSATKHDGFVRFEMEESSTVSGTLAVFESLRQEHHDKVGCVLQSMLFRTLDDAKQLLGGQPEGYPDTEAIANSTECNPRMGLNLPRRGTHRIT